MAAMAGVLLAATGMVGGAAPRHLLRGAARMCSTPAAAAAARAAALGRPASYGARELVATVGGDGTIVVTGATFSVKEGLKAMRFRWNPTERAWTFTQAAVGPAPGAFAPASATFQQGGALGHPARPAAAVTEVTLSVLSRLGELAADAQLVLVQPDAVATPPQPPQQQPPQRATAPPTASSQPQPHPPASAAAAIPAMLARAPAAATLAPARLPAALSPSSVDAWRQCPLLFRLRYVDKLKSPPTPEMFVGIAAHGALQRLFELAPAGRTAAALAGLLDDEWATMLNNRFFADAFKPKPLGVDPAVGPVIPIPHTFNRNVAGLSPTAASDPASPSPPIGSAAAVAAGDRPADEDVTRWREKAHGFLANYLKLESPADVAPLALERKLLVSLGGPDSAAAALGTGLASMPPVPFTGVLDRLDRSAGAPPSAASGAGPLGAGAPGLTDGGATAVTGRGLVVVDYKTGKPPSTAYSDATNEKIREDAFFQLKVYALLASRSAELGGEVPSMLRLLFLNGPEELSRPFHESELAATEAELLGIAAEIRAAAASHAFEPRPGKLCDWCAFRHMCPAFVPGLELGPPTLA